MRVPDYPKDEAAEAVETLAICDGSRIRRSHGELPDSREAFMMTHYMNALVEVIVATFQKHPDVTWAQVTPAKAVARFKVEGDPVLVHFGKIDNAWRVGFDVESDKSPMQLVANSIFILSGVFHAVREFLTGLIVQQPDRLVFAVDSDILRDLLDTTLARESVLDPLGYRMEADGVICRAIGS
jgi:hypothetical protein